MSLPRHRTDVANIFEEVVLLGLPHVMTTPHNRLPGSEGSLRGFPPSCNCLTGSQLLASTGVSSSTTQSRLNIFDCSVSVTWAKPLLDPRRWAKVEVCLANLAVYIQYFSAGQFLHSHPVLALERLDK
ncbi:hypothetical protein CEP54_013064 [Fusarium duplospermum]|uniref:Uncharacterized protein n=1 Tax=Fusarium duplospermum TaxID=1325734 RepID=A0A428P558_9HYPO|nr:hypothetical protein CEP54_013064 [Fusarium duplospermum]